MDGIERLLTELTDPHDKPPQRRRRRRAIEGALRCASRRLDLDGRWILSEDATEIVYEEPELRLRLRVVEPRESAWFHEPSARVAVLAEPPAGRDREAGHRALRGLRRLLDDGRARFARLSRWMATERRADEDLGWFVAEPVPEMIDRAAFHYLHLLRDGTRVTEVRRPGTGRWYSGSDGEFYPWPSAIGDVVGDGTVRDAWRAYADAYARHGIPLSLYLHIPFCARICNFCHCAKALIDDADRVVRFVDSMVDEIREHAAILGHVPLTTLYLGGGTPSVLTASCLERLLRTIASSYRFADSFQFSMEANPDSMTEEKIDAVCDVIPLDRLSMGVQTLDPEAQKQADRFNSPDKIRRLVARARARGVGVVHFDLIAGLDGLSYEGFRDDLRAVARLRPETIKIYAYRPFRLEDESLGVVVDRELVERREAQVRWGDRFLRRAHGLGLGTSAEAIREQRNLQIDFTYEHTTALLSLGPSGVSYVPHELYYEVPMDIEGYTSARRALRYPAVPTSLRGDLHGTLVKSLQMGIDVRRLAEKYGEPNVRAALADWPLLRSLGVRLERGRIVFRSASTTKMRLAKYFLASPEVRDRIVQRYDAGYDPRRKAFAELARLVDGDLLVKLGASGRRALPITA